MTPPKNAPAHAWETPGGWWRWYEMRGTLVAGVIYEMTGTYDTDATATAWVNGKLRPPMFNRTVATGTREAMLAAWRLLTGEDRSAKDRGTP